MSQSKDSSLQVLIIALTLVVAIAAGWFTLNRKNSNLALEQQRAPENQAQNESVGAIGMSEDLLPVSTALQLAQMALESGHLFEPAQSSALHFYESALLQEADNEEALLGLAQLTATLAAEANEAITAGDFKRAGIALARLTRLSPGSDETLAIQGQLTAQADALFLVLDRAIQRGRYIQATRVANAIEDIPGADLARVNLALSTIADAQSAAAAAQVALDESAITADTGITPDPAMVPPGDVQDRNTAPSDDALPARVSEPGATQNTVVAGDELPASEITVASSPVDVPETQSVIAALISNAEDRLSSNQLFAPAEDSALHYYREALIQEPTNADARLGVRRLVQTATTTALDRARQGDWAGANQALIPVSDIDLAMRTVEESRKEIRAMRVAEAAEALVNISELEFERTVSPIYPRRAKMHEVEGQVKVSFLVTENGTTDNIKVVEEPAKHARLFSKAAVTAISQWRFKPTVLDGEPIPRKTEVTVKFELTD